MRHEKIIGHVHIHDNFRLDPALATSEVSERFGEIMEQLHFIASQFTIPVDGEGAIQGLRIKS